MPSAHTGAGLPAVGQRPARRFRAAPRCERRSLASTSTRTRARRACSARSELIERLFQRGPGGPIAERLRVPSAPRVSFLPSHKQQLCIDSRRSPHPLRYSHSRMGIATAFALHLVGISRAPTWCLCTASTRPGACRFCCTSSAHVGSHASVRTPRGLARPPCGVEGRPQPPSCASLDTCRRAASTRPRRYFLTGPRVTTAGPRAISTGGILAVARLGREDGRRPADGRRCP